MSPTAQLNSLPRFFCSRNCPALYPYTSRLRLPVLAALSLVALSSCLLPSLFPLLVHPPSVSHLATSAHKHYRKSKRNIRIRGKSLPPVVNQATLCWPPLAITYLARADVRSADTSTRSSTLYSTVELEVRGRRSRR